MLPRVVVLICSAYPLLAILFVHLAVLMESGLGMHGAIIGSYKTPLGVVFNFAAMLTMGFFVFIPLGLFASFFAGWALKSRFHFLCFPAIYVALCVCSIGLALVDPIGVFEYFSD